MMVPALLFSYLVTPNPAGAKVPSPAPLTLPNNIFTQQNAHPAALMWMVQTLFILAAIGLIVLMSVQTTKSEGLSGTIGGRSESAYRGRLGLDQQLARLTSGVAYTFIVLAIVYFFLSR